MNRSIPIQIFHEKDAADLEEGKTSTPEKKVSIKTPNTKSKEALESNCAAEQSSVVMSDNGDASGRVTPSDETELLQNVEDINTSTDELLNISDVENEHNIEVEDAADDEDAASDAAAKVEADEANPSLDDMDTSEAEPKATSADPEIEQEKSEDDSAATAQKLAADALKTIATVMETFEKLETEVEGFVGTRKEKNYLRLEHELTNKLLSLDKVGVAGTQKENQIRSERKAAINRVQRALDVLENKT